MSDPIVNICCDHCLAEGVPGLDDAEGSTCRACLLAAHRHGGGIGRPRLCKVCSDVCMHRVERRIGAAALRELIELWQAAVEAASVCPPAPAGP